MHEVGRLAAVEKRATNASRGATIGRDLRRIFGATRTHLERFVALRIDFSSFTRNPKRSFCVSLVCYGFL